MIDFSMSELERIYNNGEDIANYFYNKQKSGANNSEYKEVTVCLTFLNYINESLTSFISTVKNFKDDLIHNKDYLNLGKQVNEMMIIYNDKSKLLAQVCANKNNIAVKDNLILFHECYTNINDQKNDITKLSLLITTKRKSSTYNNRKEDRCLINILNHLNYLQKNIVEPIISNLKKLELKTSK